MKLNEIESHISSTILNRGMQYYENGHVLDLEEIDEGVYHAAVEGSEIYEVNVRLGSEGLIQYSSCDCPFDMDVMCKHEVAVLLEIRDRVAVTPNKNNKSKPMVQLSDQLRGLSKDRLIEMLLEYAHDFREVKQRLELTLMATNGGTEEDNLKTFVRIIQSHIKQNADRGGFVPSRMASKAVAGAEMVLEKALEAEQNGQALYAARIGFCVLHEMAELIQSTDESSGVIEGLIDECLGLVSDIVEAREALLSSERSALFLMLLEGAEHPSLDDWEEWQLSLLESASYLVAFEEERQKWETCLDRLGAGDTADHRQDSYFSNKAALLKYQMIQRFDNGEQRIQYLEANMALSDLRQIAIAEATSQANYEEALRLILEGEQQDAARGLPGLVVKWKKQRLEVYRLTNAIESQRQLCEEFASKGEYSYYLELRQLYSSEEWAEVYARVLAALEKGQTWSSSSTYTKVLIEEKETLRLLQYVRLNPNTVVQFYPHLIGQYSEEVYQIFEKVIEQSIAVSSNRQAYKKSCQIIRELMKAGGDKKARDIITNIRLRYSNRPALMDELNSI